MLNSGAGNMDDYMVPIHINSSTPEAVLKSNNNVQEACVLFRIVFNSGLIGVICLLGLTGNILSLAILHTDRQNRVASFLLQALAVADIAVLVMSCSVLGFVYGILHSQTTVVVEWTNFIFKYVNSIGYMTQGVTIWFTVLLAINRYIAVCRPLHANRLSVRGAKIQACTVVMISFIANIPRIILRDLNLSSSALAPAPNLDDEGDNITATDHRSSIVDSQSPIMLFEILYTTLILILPLIILAGLNLRLIRELQGAKRRLRHFSRQYSGSNEDNITVVMVVVIIVVVICHTPDRIIQILRWIPFTNSRACPNWMYFAVSVSNLLIVINSSINFLVYCVFRKRFRRILVLKICHRRRNRTSSQITNHSGRLMRTHFTCRDSEMGDMNDTDMGGSGEHPQSNKSFALHSIKSEKHFKVPPTRYNLIY